MLVARRRDRLVELAAELGGRAHVFVADLAAPDVPERLIQEIGAAGLKVATLINNAGFGLAGRFDGLDRNELERMVALNCGALTALAHLVIPGMRARGEGAILNVSSTGAFQAGPGFAVYFATKAYVLSFSEALHQELKGSGIKVTALCPGPTATEFGAVAGISSDRFARLSADAAGVVAAGLAALDANRAVAVPGLLNKLTAQSSRFLPRAAMRRIVASLKL